MSGGLGRSGRLGGVHVGRDDIDAKLFQPRGHGAAAGGRHLERVNLDERGEGQKGFSVAAE